MGNTTELAAAMAARFRLPGKILGVKPLAGGNVNRTWLVRLSGGQGCILQRLNTVVFPRPEQVMHNLRVVSGHCRTMLAGENAGPEGRWEVAEAWPALDGPDLALDEKGGCWRALRRINGAVAHETVQDAFHAREAGRGLGRFHRLLATLEPERLHDTLEGFHVTPRYLAAYDRLGSRARAPETTDSRWCRHFIEQRRRLAPVLEEARNRGLLRVRVIHGDPKVSNMMCCAQSGRVVALIDLDTVKPGLIQYDLGDCLRSCCNPAGEEAADPGRVEFDLDCCREILAGYLSEAAAFLTTADRNSLYEAVRLIGFELGLRFFTDFLAGNPYFRTADPTHNLRRALVQFRLVERIEAQERRIRLLLKELT